MIETEAPEKWVLLLYVAGMTPEASRALSNLEAICKEHLSGRYSVEVIDLKERPDAASADQIYAVPTLVRIIPTPMRRIVGDLSDKDKVMRGLDLTKSGEITDS